ncbi:MAG TPA: DUF2782 domain-containing protein [Rhodanobacteraceae bacterium]
MRTLSRFALLPLAAVLGTSFAIAAEKAPPKAEVPPPPGINDPGVTAAPAQAQRPADAPAAGDADPLAPLPKPDTRLVRDRVDRDPDAMNRRMANSEHVTRQQGDDTVDEYRQNGHVWMIRIQPRNGPVETFMDTTGNGRLTRDPQQGPVAPVYFSLYEWN